MADGGAAAPMPQEGQAVRGHSGRRHCGATCQSALAACRLPRAVRGLFSKTQEQSGAWTFGFLSRPQQLEAGDCDAVCFWLPLHEDRHLFFPARPCCSWDPPWFLLALRPLFSSAIISPTFQLAPSPRRSCNSLAATTRRHLDHPDHLSALPLSSRTTCRLAIAFSARL